MKERLTITPEISVPLEAVELSFVRGAGPGGQNVNKVATSAQLRFDLMGSPHLPDGLKRRAAQSAGSRLTSDGAVVMTGSRFRTQVQNRADVLERLRTLLAQAATPPKRRIATRPTLAAKRRRIEAKKKKGAKKAARGRVSPES